MGLFCWVVVGLLVGFFARRLFPGRPGGLSATLVLSVIGALIGGYIANYFNYGTLMLLDPLSLLFALAGSLAMVLVVKCLRI